MANNQLLASDNFASGSLAAGWSNTFGLLKGQVVVGSPNVVEPNALSTQAGQIWTGLIWPNDQTSEVTATVISEAGTFLILNVRLQSGANSGYAANINNGSVQVYRNDNGVQTQLGASITGLTFAANDVWSFSAFGPCLTVYQNYKQIFFWVDTTYTSGYPGFQEFTTINITHVTVSSWRGYNAVQQDGIWTKQGAANIPLVASDINTGTSFVNSGIDSSSIILREGNAQILSGIVYKIWFGTASGIQYAESSDGKTWSRYPSTLIAGFSFPQIFKNGNTYYLYVQSNTIAPGTGNINLYTSTNGINWTNQSTTVLARGSAGTWDATSIYLFSPVAIINGTWYALYSGTGTNPNGAFAMGLATSSDGITWSKYSGNPVAQNVWASVPYLINGTYYLWGEGVPPGQESPALDPTVGIRLQSIDLINWTNRIVSLQHTELAEGVNAVKGFAYPTALITVGSQTYMYYEVGPSNTASNTGASWNLSLAIAPGPMSSLITVKEDALQQVSTDNFTSGVGNLSGNWITPTGSTKLQIVAGNLVEPTAISTHCTMAYTGASFSNSQYSSVTIATMTAVTPQVSPAVLVQTGAQNCYIGGPFNVSTGVLGAAQIGKLINGVFSGIGPSVACTPQVGDVFTLAVKQDSSGNNVLTLYQNGYVIVQVVDLNTTFTSGFPGMDLFTGTAVADAQASAWAGGNAGVIPQFVYSVPDCRNFGNFPNKSRSVQSTSIFDVQTSSNPTVPGTDSRAMGAPQDCRQSGNIPQNSRTPGTFGPGVN